MKICGVTVTYGNRAEFCIAISKQAFVQGIHQLIIVDNGSAEESREKLRQFSGQNSFVQVISLGRNTGSSGGFGEGIQAFLASDSDIILFLDDDNMLGAGALSKMITFWNSIDEIGKEGNVALAAFRKDRPNMIAALQTGNAKFVLPPIDSFMGFHFKLVWRFISQRIKPFRSSPGDLRENLEIGATAYGGLWMHRNLCSRIGLPDSSYILYMDDFEYTMRIRDIKGKIILLRDCIIQDVEGSYYLPVQKKWLYHSVLYASSDSITYYTCRNIIYFSKKYLINRRLIYQTNRLMYFIVVFLIASLSNKSGKLKVIYLAASDGEAGNMGQKEMFPL